MKYLLVLLNFTCLAVVGQGQDVKYILQYHKFWVQFTDKDNNPFSINNPEAFLSQRSLERRTKQNIPIDLTDLPVTPSYVDSIHSAGADILNRSKWLNGVTIATTDSTVLAQIEGFSFVQLVEPVAALVVVDSSGIDTIGKRDREFVAPETLVHDEELYGASYNQINMMNGEYLHQLNYKGQGMIIAVLDAGFSMVDQHPAFDSLWQNDQIMGYHDFVDLDNDVFHASSHGLSVLSCMGGNILGELVGTAPKAKYLLLRSEDGATEYRIEEYNWASAAEYADSVGADVINSSLGYSTFQDTTMNYTYKDMNGSTAVITRAADLAAKKGMIVVTSAGNLGNSNWRYVSAPADGDSVLTIGAVDDQGRYVSFSSQGPTFDGRVKPDVVAQGKQSVVASGSDAVGMGNGTSFSSPITAGLVACFWQSNPGKSNMEIIQRIRESASSYSMPNDTLGYGIPDFRLAHYKSLEEKGDIYVQENLPRAYPNPFKDQLNLMIFTQTEGDYVVEVFDGVGKRIYKEQRYLFDGHFVDFDLSDIGILQNGVYLIRVGSSGNTNLLKVLRL